MHKVAIRVVQGAAYRAQALTLPAATQVPGGNITKFLNRLLGVHVDLQHKIFSCFMALLVRLRRSLL